MHSAQLQRRILAFIYGSYVSVFSKSASVWTAESDVDLLVVGDVDPRPISSMARKVGSATSRQINYTILSAREFAQKVSKSDSFIGEVLAKPILPLVGFPKGDCTTPIRRKPEDLVALLERSACTRTRVDKLVSEQERLQ